MQLLVRAMVGAPDHMRDREVDVVDDAREMEGRRSFVAPQHHAFEALWQPRGPGRLEVPAGALALAHRAVVPVDPEPPQVVEDRLLPARQVARRIRVVDAQQQPVAEPTVRDSAHRVADMQRSGRARSESHADHGATLVRERDARRALARDEPREDRADERDRRTDPERRHECRLGGNVALADRVGE